ncbi:DUF4374 domain-containing protein [Sinomicrobium oceani]|uniref:DUF4374 domain-containing protein n=1 Tax=Sinomicrobium oceani TaxID=1150368 RepID=UPI00227B908F|nr:DUF4374 domain-containing protein [Sinomicrobium oceani]
MRKPSYFLSLVMLGSATLFTACSSSDDDTSGGGGENPGSDSKYVITATPNTSESVADYILTADQLTEGRISTKGNGVEQDGTYRYYVTTNNMFFSMLYGQGNPGAVTAYELNNNGDLERLTNFQSETVQAFAPVNDDILLTKISRNAESPVAYWYRFSTESLTFVAEGQINTQELADKENGEIAFFTWITQVGDKVYMPYMTVKGCCNDTFGTEYANEANIAVYTYPEMELETIIHDDRTSYIGRYFVNGLTVDENGDAYAFSSGIATTNGEVTSEKPSAITRIKKGTTEFDDYYFDLEEATGMYLTDHVYAGNGKFLGIMETEKTSAYSTGKNFVIIDAYNKTTTSVTGLPTASQIQQLTGRNSYVSEDGSVVYVGITLEGSEGSFVYSIDVDAATASQGLEVEGGFITAISKLDPAE